MKWVATKPVSLFWQTLFIFVFDIYPVYRIQKLKRYLIINVIPSGIIATALATIFAEFDCMPNWWLTWIGYDTCVPFEMNIFVGIVYGGFLVFSIYLIRKWSVQWNENISSNSINN